MNLRIDRITLAVNNMEAMVGFYNNVFDARLLAVEMVPGIRFYRGTLAGMGLLLCPNEIAGVNAHQNRHQLRFVVDDIEDMLARVVAAGGVLVNAIQELGSDRIAGGRDPDGNTFELLQYLS